MLGLEKAEDDAIAKLGEEFFSYEIPSIVFHEAVKAVPDDIKFHVAFIDIYRLFEGSEQRQEEVFERLATPPPPPPPPPSPPACCPLYVGTHNMCVILWMIQCALSSTVVNTSSPRVVGKWVCTVWGRHDAFHCPQSNI